MPYTTSPVDGVKLFYRDYRPSSTPTPFQPQTQDLSMSLVFLHGWPMSSAMWEHLMLPLCESWRIRCIAVDRRGFGRSDWCGKRRGDEIGYETFAKDTMHVLEEAGMENFVFVGASMGCGEALLAYSGSEWVRERCKGFIWLGPSLPFPLQTPSNSQAPSRALWDMILSGLRANRPTFVRASLPGVFGAQDGGPDVVLDPTVLEHYERMVDEADGLAMERCVQIITEKDFTADIERLAKDNGNVKILILHGDSDNGMPYEASATILKEMLGDKAYVRIYEKAAHGLYLTHHERVLQDVLDFVRTVSQNVKLQQ